MQSLASWKTLSLAAAIVAGAIVGTAAHAQDRYPSRPIDFIVPWGPGGGADQVARKLAQLLEPEGVSIISDVDDTIKHSNVPDRRDLFRNTFVREFVPVPGMPELYQACAARGAAFRDLDPWTVYRGNPAVAEGKRPQTL